MRPPLYAVGRRTGPLCVGGPTYHEAVPNEPLDPQPVGFATPMGDVEGALAIEFEEPVGIVVAKLTSRRGGDLEWKFTRNAKLDPIRLRIPPSRELGDAAIQAIQAKPVRAFRIPAGRVQSVFRTRGAIISALLAMLALATLPFFGIYVGDEVVRGLLIGLVVLVTVTGMIFAGRGVVPKRQYVTPGGTYRFDELLADRPGAALTTRRVDQVKEHYGRLLSDIVYRIENPALFDPAVETTGAFTNALIQWDNSGATMPPAERSTLAARVQLAFESARKHAELVGMDHVPADARPEVERALKAARVSVSSRSKAEARAGLQQAIRILEALRLYYLPSAAEAEAITGGRPVLALPGRRPRPRAGSETDAV